MCYYPCCVLLRLKVVRDLMPTDAWPEERLPADRSPANSCDVKMVPRWRQAEMVRILCLALVFYRREVS